MCLVVEIGSRCMFLGWCALYVCVYSARVWYVVYVCSGGVVLFCVFNCFKFVW